MKKAIPACAAGLDMNILFGEIYDEFSWGTSESDGDVGETFGNTFALGIGGARE